MTWSTYVCSAILLAMKTTTTMLVISTKYFCSACRNVLRNVYSASNEWPYLLIFKFHCHRLVSPEADAEMETGVKDVYYKSKPVKGRKQDWTRERLNVIHSWQNLGQFLWGTLGQIVSVAHHDWLLLGQSDWAFPTSLKSCLIYERLILSSGDVL